MISDVAVDCVDEGDAVDVVLVICVVVVFMLC